VPGLSDVNAMQDFIQSRGVGGLHHIPDTEGNLWRRFGITSQGAYVLINGDGTVRKTPDGNLESDVLGLINS